MAVLITRPDERGKQLVDWLNQAGIVALYLPLFNIEAGAELADLPIKLAQLKEGDYVLAVSKSAVDFAAKTLSDTGFHWRKDLHYFTVGHRTAQYLACQTEGTVRYPLSVETSEGLLNLPAMQNLNNKTVLILRGNGGREYFAQQAKLRGAQIEYLECYHRTPICYNNEEQTSICKRSGVQTIVATSLETVRALLELVPETEHPWLKDCRLVTVSRRIANFAEQIGWKRTVIAPRADNQSLLDILLEIK